MKKMLSEKGQATVELALVLSVLTLILFGIIDFGRVFHAHLTINHAGKEAARSMSLGKTNEEITSIAKNSSTGLDVSKLSVSISPTQAERVHGNYGTVTLTYSLPIITPVVAVFLPNPYPIENKTTARME